MPERIAFNRTRQGLRDLDHVGGYVVPYSLDGQPAAPRPNIREILRTGSREGLAWELAGGALALLGLSRRSIPGLILAVAGGALLYRGLTTHRPAASPGMAPHVPQPEPSGEELVYRY